MKTEHLVGACVLLLACSFANVHSSCDAYQSGTASNGVTNQEEAKDSLPIARRSPTKFLRLQTDEFNNPVALQTATAKYVLKDDKGEIQLEVSLESVIHIADASYYRSFQKRFERYDAVLYESLIKPNDAQASVSNASKLPTGFQILRQVSTGTLGLAYKFEEIDFAAPNLRNADLTPEEISDRMESFGQDKTTLLIDLLTHIAQKFSADQPNENATVAGDATSARPEDAIKFNFSILTDPDGVMKIRRIMATLLVNSKLLESPFPPSIHQLIIGDRNDRAMSILEDAFKSGKRRIAIFYGVGHMADFEKRLVEKHGMKLAGVNWRNAWDLRDGAIEGAPLEGLIESAFRDSFKEKLRQMAKGLTDKPKAAESKVIESNETPDPKTDDVKALEEAIKALEAKLKQMEEKDKKKDG